MSSAIRFNLDQSKILSSGNGLKRVTLTYRRKRQSTETTETRLCARIGVTGDGGGLVNKIYYRKKKKNEDIGFQKTSLILYNQEIIVATCIIRGMCRSRSISRNLELYRIEKRLKFD